MRPIYLDCNATTPIEPRVKDVVFKYMTEEFGNAGSRTHEYGLNAKKAINKAREQVAQVVACKPEEVVFTSGATESNNIAILGLEELGLKEKRTHIITSKIEHKAVLEPIKHLEQKGFSVTYLPVTKSGTINPQELESALQDDTLLVSIMHVNNETGVIQPIDEYCNILANHDAFFHTDAAQGFGKVIQPLQNKRIDFISISGHKIYAPKGIGVIITRRRGYERSPLKPIMFGGGQERGLRPGTQPVHLIAGLGEASEIAINEHEKRREACLQFREKLLEELSDYNLHFNGNQEKVVPHVVNVSLEGIDGESAVILFKNKYAISNGSACTSQSYQPSHVLEAMGLPQEQIEGALRFSWCHLI